MYVTNENQNTLLRFVSITIKIFMLPNNFGSLFIFLSIELIFGHLWWVLILSGVYYVIARITLFGKTAFP